jgi:hypothetical protein
MGWCRCGACLAVRAPNCSTTWHRRPRTRKNLSRRALERRGHGWRHRPTSAAKDRNSVTLGSYSRSVFAGVYATESRQLDYLLTQYFKFAMGVSLVYRFARVARQQQAPLRRDVGVRQPRRERVLQGMEGSLADFSRAVPLHRLKVNPGLDHDPLKPLRKPVPPSGLETSHVRLM